MTKFFVDALGNYLGGYASAVVTVNGQPETLEALPPAGAIQVPAPPAHGLQKWNGATWENTPELEELEARQSLGLSDAAGFRVLEDVLGVLVAKGVLTLAELPAEARGKIESRALARGKL